MIAIGLAVLVLCMAMPAMAQGQKNIYQAAVDAGFTKFISGLKFTGLDKTLSAAGQYTMLAPTDDAFNKLPSGATIVKPNIQASNGMIQGIDRVMLMPF